MKIDCSRPVWTERTNELTNISISWAPVGVKNFWYQHWKMTSLKSHLLSVRWMLKIVAGFDALWVWALTGPCWEAPRFRRGAGTLLFCGLGFWLSLLEPAIFNFHPYLHMFKKPFEDVWDINPTGESPGNGPGGNTPRATIKKYMKSYKNTSFNF